jgi:hypothetical protein
MANCPICGRHIGEFTNDPLLTIPSLSTEEYKGFTQLIKAHIQELQDERHQQEIDNGVIPLTEFSPINDTGLFQNIKQYIIELRNSTEKILVATGMTLSEFLSTDEDGNPMTLKNDWTDPELNENKFQCKAIHIEDLRHFIVSIYANIYLSFQSTEDNGVTYKKYYGYKNGKQFDTSFVNLKSGFTQFIPLRSSIDNTYLYYANNVGGNGFLYVYNRTTLVLVTTIALGSLGTSSVTFKTKNDTEFVYIYGQGNFSGGNKTKVWKVQKEDLSRSGIGWLLLNTVNSTSIWHDIAVGKNYVYLIRNVYPSGTSDFFIVIGDDYQLYTAYSYISVLNKTDLSINHYWSSSHYSGEHFLILPETITVLKFANTDTINEILCTDNSKLYAEFIRSDYNRSGDTYILNTQVGQFSNNDLTLSISVPFIVIKSVSVIEIEKYLKLIVDQTRIYAYYREVVPPYFSLMFLNKTFNELFRTNLLDYIGEPSGTSVSVNSDFWTFCSDNQYLFST